MCEIDYFDLALLSIPIVKYALFVLHYFANMMTVHLCIFELFNTVC